MKQNDKESEGKGLGFYNRNIIPRNMSIAGVGKDQLGVTISFEVGKPKEKKIFAS